MIKTRQTLDEKLKRDCHGLQLQEGRGLLGEVLSHVIKLSGSDKDVTGELYNLPTALTWELRGRIRSCVTRFERTWSI